MQKETCLGSTNKMTSGSELRMSNICQVGLQQLGKNRILIRKWFYGYFCNLSPFIPTFCPTQGYSLRFLALTHHKCATSGTLQLKSHTNASFYMLLILQLGPPLCIIIRPHQSLLEPNTNKNITLAMM
jgi:hypothetical protein